MLIISKQTYGLPGAKGVPT